MEEEYHLVEQQNTTEYQYNYNTITSKNKSIEEEDLSWLSKYINNRIVSEQVFIILVCCYTLFIVIGTCGNALVITAVVRKVSMRTVRNMFILNLALSDMLLCMFTMPFTLVEVTSMYWPLWGEMCRLVGGFQAISIFVSTLNISAIALDRYMLIMYPTTSCLQTRGALVSLVGIWIIAGVMASPLMVFRYAITHHFDLEELDIHEIQFCVEKWPFYNGRLYYSLLSFVCQYAVPIVIVSYTYVRISFRLKDRMVQKRKTSIKNNPDRSKKTNILLMAIAVVFGISWLPLNLCNIILDLTQDKSLGRENTRILFAVCHLFGMSSACSNPILYGWLNDNFKKEFKEIFFCTLPRCKTHSGRRRAGKNKYLMKDEQEMMILNTTPKHEQGEHNVVIVTRITVENGTTDEIVNV